MEIFALTGPSGTGKSYQAQAVCLEKGIDAIVDDGLYIYRERIEAGTSAKHAKTYVGAIKVAIFTDEAHAESVRKKISETGPKRILIIGTSDEMADKIANRLSLPEIKEYIHIEEITTEEEREQAERQRKQQGKHVIPAPTLQLKRDFAGYFMDPVQFLIKAKGFSDRTQEAIHDQAEKIFGGKQEKHAHRTVVRPTYSYMGDFLISDLVLTDIAECVRHEVDGVALVVSVTENTSPEELKVKATIDIEWDADVMATAAEYQRKFKEAIEEMTAFNVVRTDIEVRQLVKMPRRW